MTTQRDHARRPRIVAITGATGFVGRRLLKRHLAFGDNIRVLTRQKAADCIFPNEVKIFSGDLNGDFDVLRQFATGADVLYHCAAELSDAQEMNLTNVIGTRNLAEVAAHNIRHWVQLSSVAIYGRQENGRVTESTEPEVGSVYPTTLSKLEAEKIVKEHSGRGEFTYSILRPCKIYGADMRDNSLRSMARYIDRGLYFFIGAQGASANYVHVDNVVEALVQCATHEAAQNRAFNLCDGFTVEEIVTALARAQKRPIPRWRMPESLAWGISRLASRVAPGFPLTENRLAGLTSRVVYASDAIRSSLGYAPIVSLETGVSELIEANQ